MAAQLTKPNQIRQALEQSGGKPVEVEDDQTHKFYVIVARDQFRDMQLRMIHDGDLSEAEMLAAAARGLNDPDGWGAPGMDDYNTETQP